MISLVLFTQKRNENLSLVLRSSFWWFSYDLQNIFNPKNINLKTDPFFEMTPIRFIRQFLLDLAILTLEYLNRTPNLLSCTSSSKFLPQKRCRCVKKSHRVVFGQLSEKETHHGYTCSHCTLQFKTCYLDIAVLWKA